MASYGLASGSHADRSKAMLLLWILFVSCVSCLSLLCCHCSLVVTCWKRDDLFAFLCVMFSCVFVTSPYGVLGQVWNLIVSIPYICVLPNFQVVLSLSNIFLINIRTEGEVGAVNHV